MSNTLKYIIDETGEKTTVLVPVKVWDTLNNNYKKLEEKLKIFNGIQNGLAEISSSKKSGKKLQTLKEFLSESSR